jgi:putative transposase
MTPYCAQTLRSQMLPTPVNRQYQTYLTFRERWCYLYRAIERSGDLVDIMLSEYRDMAAAKALFRSAKSATGIVPDRVTTDGHGSYPRAIRSMLGSRVVHRTSAFKNNRLEQDHRGIKGRIRCMRGFKSFTSAEHFCRSYDELRNHLRLRVRHNQHVPANRRRMLHPHRATTVLTILAAG